MRLSARIDMPRRARASLTAAAIVAVMMALPGVAWSAGPRQMSGPTFVQLLKKHHVISEAVNLDQQEIDQPIICHKCTFKKPISAVGATFKRTVDLSGSTFEGDVDMSQATFLAPALFGPGGPNTITRPSSCA